MDARDDARRVAVVGGGVAGLSAAIHLAEAGLPVELYEQFDVLGGKVKGRTQCCPVAREGGNPSSMGCMGGGLTTTTFDDTSTAHGLMAKAVNVPH
jgi:monoamine oxidase